MKSRVSRTTFTIVLAATALVVAPILVRGFPREVSRWYLAAAANAVAFNDEAGVQRNLQKAKEWNPGVTEDRNYWMLRIVQTNEDDVQLQLEVLKDSVKVFPDMVTLGISLADYRAEKGDFKSALELLNFAFGEQPPTTFAELNLAAYYRALASQDLDKALDQINRALAIRPKDAALLDTRAWVLYQMGKLTEALVDADSAVKASEDEYQKLPPGKPPSVVTSAEQPSGKPGNRKGSQPASNESAVASVPNAPLTHTRRTAGVELWSLGALKYHRAKILEAIGRESEAATDYQWLKDQYLPLDNRLF